MVRVTVKSPQMWQAVPAALPEPSASHGEGSAASSAFLFLLRVTAQTGGQGWGALLYALLILALETVFSLWFVAHLFKSGTEMLAYSGRFVQVALQTDFFGLTTFLVWASIATSVVSGRRRYWTLLSSIRRLLRGAAPLPGFAEAARSWRRHVTGLLIAALALLLFASCSVMYSILGAIGCNKSSLLTCVVGIFWYLPFIWMHMCFYLIPLKFVFAGQQLLSGLGVVNTGLRAVVDKRRPPDRALLQQLNTLQAELSSHFSRLTNDMSQELLVTMLYGVISITSVLVLVVGYIHGMLASTSVVITVYLIGTLLALVTPCEMSQRVLNEAGETRDLLLHAEWHHPDLLPELTLFRERVRRDLDTLGDQGLFRLCRSTVLSVVTTILTYFIVLLQFYLPELDYLDGGGPAGNGTV